MTSELETVSKAEAERGRFFDTGRPIVSELMRSRESRILLHGPLSCGKTRGALEKMRAACLKYDRCRWLLLGLVRKWLTKSALVTWEEKVIVKGELIPDRVQRDRRSQYRFPNGSIIDVAGLDDPQSVLSTEYDGAIVIEANNVPRATIEILDGRLRYGRMPYQQLMMDCNPQSPRHWLYKAMHDIVKREDGSEGPWLKGMAFRHTDNPALYNSDGTRTKYGNDYLPRIYQYTGVRFARYVEGRWVQAEGVVYDRWDEALNIVPRFKPPSDWRRVWSIDFGYTNPFCYSSDTEILTSNGWKYFTELKPADAVGTVNPNNRRMEWQIPLDYIVKRFDGEMINGSTTQCGADFLVTPDHQMVLEHRKSGRWEKRRADEMPMGWSIPTGWEPCEGDDEDFEFTVEKTRSNQRELPPTTRGNFAEFIGLVLSEGYVKLNQKGGGYVRIAQKKNTDEVRRILSALGWEWSESINKKTGVIDFSIGSRQLAEKLTQWGCGVKSLLKYIPIELMSWGTGCLRRLLNGLLLGDGSPRRKNESGQINSSRRYHTSSLRLANDIQAIAAILGMPTKMHVVKRGSGYANPSSDKMYIVQFHSKKRAAIETLKINRVEYHGNVYCVTVPNGMVIVRRNGRPMLCGNCWQDWAIDHDGRMYLVREIYRTKLLVEDAAALIKQIASDVPNPEAIVCDHDREDRATLERHLGLRTIPAQKEILNGIDEVSSRMKPAGDGRPRLFIMDQTLVGSPDEDLVEAKEPTGILGEMDEYVWAKSQDGLVTKDKPDDKRNHSMDAMRYAVKYVDGGSQPASEDSYSTPAPDREIDAMFGNTREPLWG